MAFVDGFLAFCSAIGTGTCTEVVAPGYTRQPISFSTPVGGASVSTRPYSFGRVSPGTPWAGRAVYDAPTGGNLLLVLPFATARAWPEGGPTDQAEAGHLHLALSALAAYPDGAAFSGTFAAGAVLGTSFDEADVITRHAINTATGQEMLQANTGVLSAGVALTVTRGVLRAS